MATIRDVAQLAEVSTATVSHVLNETRAVSELLRARVRKAMEELDYRPNVVARSLRISETLTLGLIVPDVTIPFFAQVARSLESAAHQAGYSVILCNSSWSLERELRYLDNLLARQVDGLICISPGLTDEHIMPVVQRGTPVVWFEDQRPGLKHDAVMVDNVKGAYDATRHLLDLGHRRIGCIPGMLSARLTLDRLQGYRQALDEQGLRYDEALLCFGDYTPPTGRAAAQCLLRLRERPSALFAFNDMMAMGALQAVIEAGLRVPQDVAVVGFDGISLTDAIYPPLSTVEQPVERMARLAIGMLLDRIRGVYRAEGRVEVVAPRLLARASTLGYD